MADRASFARIIAQLRDSPPFQHYVKTLEERRDAVIHQLINGDDQIAGTSVKLEALRGKAQAYDELIRSINTALKDASA